MNQRPPRVVIIAGANGSGKSTSARLLIPPKTVFINADEIAKQLPENTPGNRDMEAGRLLLRQMDDLAQNRQDLAVETTLASRSLAPRMSRLISDGYLFNLIFVWVPDPNLSVERVASRVRSGGHNIPEAVIRRRYNAGLINFMDLYRPLANRWRVYQNLDSGFPQLIASGTMVVSERIYFPRVWKSFLETVKNAAP